MPISHEIEIGFTDFVYINEEILFCNIFSGDIVKLDLERDEFVIETSIGKIDNQNKMQYGLIEKCDDNLIFIPRNSTKILVYNLEEKSKRYIELKQFGEKFYKPLFLSACRHKDDLFLIPGRYPFIVKMHVKTFQIQYINFDSNFSEFIGELYFQSNALMVDGKLFVLSAKENVLMVIDENGLQESIRLNSEWFGVLSMLKWEDNIILAGFSSKILMINLKTFMDKEIDCYMNDERPKNGIGKLVLCGDTVLAIAINQPIIYEVSAKNGCLCKWLEYNTSGINSSVLDRFTKCDILGAEVIGNRILMYSTIRNSIIEINIQTKEIKYHDTFSWELQNKQNYLREYLKELKIINEDKMTLEQFLRLI